MNPTGPAAKAAIAAVVRVTSLTLAGCFPNPLDQLREEVAKGGAEELIEGLTGGGVDVDVDDPKTAAEQARQALLSDGWGEAFWSDGSGVVNGMLRKGDFGVYVSAADAGSDALLSYGVLQTSEGS